MIARTALRRISSATSLLNNRNIIPVISSLGNQIQSQKKSNNTPLELQNRGQQLLSYFSTSSNLRCEAKTDVQKKIDDLINESSVVVFMKGVPAQPRCGFSNAVCQIMRMHDVPFVGHDILSDEEIRTGIHSMPENLKKSRQKKKS